MKLRYVLIPVVLTLLLAEGLLRIFWPLYFPDNYRIYQYDPAAGYRLKSSLHSLRTTDYQEEILTNRSGSANFQQDFSAYQNKVFALGDSLTQGIGLPADASYPFQLDLLLNVRDGRYFMDYGVVNLGVAGYGVKQAIVRLKEYAEKIGSPRYILFLGCDNDVGDDQAFLAGAIHKKLLAGNPRFSPYLVRSWLWLKFDTEIGKRLTFLHKIRRRQQIVAQKATNPQNSAEMLAPAFRALMNLSRGMGATLILSWMPVRLSTQMPPEYRWLQEFCRRQGLPFADWFPMARAIREQIPALPFENNHSAGHYRTWVNSMVARGFAQQIRQHRVP
jgi:lysophospholipase L1-like esterase